MSSEIQILMWALAGFGALLVLGVTAVITLLWQLKSSQVQTVTRLDAIGADVGKIWALHGQAAQERANLEGRVTTLELVQARA